MQADDAGRIAQTVAREYITRVKHWKPNEFETQIVGQTGDNVVVDAVHLDDLRAKASNKSVQLHIDVSTKSVIKELAYQ